MKCGVCYKTMIRTLIRVQQMTISQRQLSWNNSSLLKFNFVANAQNMSVFVFIQIIIELITDS